MLTGICQTGYSSEVKEYRDALNDSQLAVKETATTVQPTKPTHTSSDNAQAGRKHYEQGNYEEALDHYSKAAAAEPDNGDIQYQIGLTHQGMLDYGAAQEAYKRAVKLQPTLGDAWAHMAEMQYRNKQFDKAADSLNQAEKHGAREAYTAYIRGLVLMEQGQYAAAIESLKRALQANSAFEQKSVYALGMVYSKQKKTDDAQAAFQRAIAINPKSMVAVYANFGLQFLKKPEVRLFHIDLAYSLQYDDNVVLNPGGTVTSLLPSGQQDFAHLISLHADYERIIQGPLTIRSDISYYSSLHQKLSYMDIGGIGLSLTPSYAAAFGTVALQARFDYYAVGRQKYLTAFGASPSLSLSIGKRQHGLLSGSYQHKIFANQHLLAVEENRTADNYSLGYMHYIYTDNEQGYLGFGYTFDMDNTHGANWDYTGHRITTAIIYPITETIGTQLNSDYYIQDYKNRHSVFGKQRKDSTLAISPMLTYRLKWADLHLQYTRVQARSNTRVYQYQRNIFDAGFQMRY